MWALPIYFPMAQLIGGFGIDGQDTALMLLDNRVSPETGQPMSIDDLIAAAPELVVLRGGSINDLQGANSSTIAAAVNACVANHREILQRMVAGGLKVLDCGIFGYGDGSSAFNPNPGVVRSALLQVNQALATMAGEFGAAVRYVSPLGTLHDATGRFLPGMTIDGLHLSLAGGLRQAQLEADAIAAWLGSGAGTAYAGTNLMSNASMTSTGGAGTPPTGFAASGMNSAVDNPQVESIGGKTFFTVRVTLPPAASFARIQLPFTLGALGVNEVLGCEFDFICDVQTGSAPRITEFDARQEYVWGGGQVTFFAGYSARESSTTTTSLRGRVVFLPFKLPASGNSFDADQSQLSLRLGFAETPGTVLKFGVGNPRLVRV
ncbi:MAG: SGNH/GDSL hydrolase family protein [Rubrivivax sp.]